MFPLVTFIVSFLAGAGITYALIVFLVPFKLNLKVIYPLPQKGDVVVITGASRGIGKACALELSNQGFNVYAGVRTKAAAERLKSEHLTPLILDVTSTESIRNAVQHLSEEHPDGIVALINNAGINVGPYPIEYANMSAVRNQFDVNLFGQIQTTQAFLPLLRKKQGRIIFMSSVAGSISTAFGGVYASSKFAVEAVADALRRELAPWSMSVSVVKPGELRTEMLDRYQEDGKKVFDALPDRGQRLYGAFYENLKPTRDKFVGHVNQATKAVLHAVTSATPQTRYLVGSDAMLKEHLKPFSKFGLHMPVWSLLPDRFLDKQMRRVWPKKYEIPKE